MMKAIALLLAFLPAFIAAQNTTKPCDLTCHANATCVRGFADFSNHSKHPNGQPFYFLNETLSPNGYHCACPEGFTGLHCGREYISCLASDHHCYNGGSCIPGSRDQFGNEQEFCDCGDAIDKEGIKHVGKYCEIPVPTPCGDDDSVFCVNGGSCKETFADEPHHPCHCGPEHDGPHCEYFKGQVPNCTLKCHHDGQCHLGFKDYTEALSEYQEYWEDDFNNTLMHCLCKNGFFGPKCEVTSTKCNNKHCFNGGSCKQVTKKDGTVAETCDCSTATGGTNKTFSGKYCQYEATALCANKDKTESGNATFCLNGGTCKNDASDLSCKCPANFSGPLCEVASSEQSEPTSVCSIQCDNGGICNKGVKDYSFLKKHGFDVAELEHITNQTHNDRIEHCICPIAFTGLKCEVAVEKCGENDHICLHGSTCTQDGGNYSCDCEQAFNGLDHFSGKYCQHKSTSICTPDNKPGSGKNKFAFCVNNGTCKKLVDENEEHYGCECTAGYTGDHCEARTETTDEVVQDPNTSSESSSGAPTVAIVFIVLAVVMSTVTAALFYRRFKFWKEKPEAPVEGPQFGHKAEPVLDMGPPHDLDGNDLENVEII